VEARGMRVIYIFSYRNMSSSTLRILRTTCGSQYVPKFVLLGAVAGQLAKKRIFQGV